MSQAAKMFQTRIEQAFVHRHRSGITAWKVENLRDGASKVEESQLTSSDWVQPCLMAEPETCMDSPMCCQSALGPLAFFFRNSHGAIGPKVFRSEADPG